MHDEPNAHAYVYAHNLWIFKRSEEICIRSATLERERERERDHDDDDDDDDDDKGLAMRAG
jgi:hypothetical protein